jgi:hypothetical protein
VENPVLPQSPARQAPKAGAIFLKKNSMAGRKKTCAGAGIYQSMGGFDADFQLRRFGKELALTARR